MKTLASMLALVSTVTAAEPTFHQLVSQGAGTNWTIPPNTLATVVSFATNALSTGISPYLTFGASGTGFEVDVRAGTAIIGPASVFLWAPSQRTAVAVIRLDTLPAQDGPRLTLLCSPDLATWTPAATIPLPPSTPTNAFWRLQVAP